VKTADVPHRLTNPQVEVYVLLNSNKL